MWGKNFFISSTSSLGVKLMAWMLYVLQVEKKGMQIMTSSPLLLSFTLQNALTRISMFASCLLLILCAVCKIEGCNYILSLPPLSL